jgi:hypothetical protein
LLKIYKIRGLIESNLICIKKQRERVCERGEEGEIERGRKFALTLNYIIIFIDEYNSIAM